MGPRADRPNRKEPSTLQVRKTRADLVLGVWPPNNHGANTNARLAGVDKSDV